MNECYYIRHEINEHWWNFPWVAYKGDNYPCGQFIGNACTRRGALRYIRKSVRRNQRNTAKEVTTEYIHPKQQVSSCD
jgi:hypothetical protein